MLKRLFTAVFSTFVFVAQPLLAQTNAFYAGKRITIVIGTDAGGGYGLYAEVLAKYMPKYIPGHPVMVVQYMPGAGGATAMAYMNNFAARDGTVIATLSQTGALFQVLQSNVRYDASKLTYIGRMATANAAGLISAASGVKTLEDIKTKEVIFGTTGSGDQSYLFPTLLKNLYGFKFRLVAGYPGTNDMNLAIQRHEIDGRVGAWTSWKSAVPQAIKDGTLVPILEVGLEHSPDLQGIPLVTDLAKNDQDKKILLLMSSYAAIGRAISGAPGIPADRLATLREAFDKTVNDPEFLAAAKTAKLPIEPMSGEKIAEIVNQTISTPEDQVARTKKLLDFPM